MEGVPQCRHTTHNIHHPKGLSRTATFAFPSRACRILYGTDRTVMFSDI